MTILDGFYITLGIIGALVLVWLMIFIGGFVVIYLKHLIYRIKRWKKNQPKRR
jgi:hypothetical protein